MTEVIRVEDQSILFPTKNFPYGYFPFEEFNPVQSRIIDCLDGDSNIAIAAATSAGKTVCAEMYLSYEFSQRGKKGMYISPLKALAQEKLDDWTTDGHQFSKKKISICTGDYKLTAARKKELENSDLIIMTSEMLSSRTRNYRSENNNFLKDVNTLVVDECFPYNAMVRIEDNVEVPIGKIIENENIEYVVSFDESNNRFVKKKITRRITKEHKNDLVRVQHEHGKFVCTKSHKIWTSNRGYVKAEDLTQEDIIKWIPLEDDLTCKICSKTFKKQRFLTSHYLYGHITLGKNTKHSLDVKKCDKCDGYYNVYGFESHVKGCGKEKTNNYVYKSKKSRILSVKRWGRDNIEKVYDLEIEDTHNYFVNGVLVSNCHLMTVTGRGDHLENALMKITEINSDVRLVLLSATMPNVDEVCQWASKLTNRNTYYLESTYRPCPLQIHYVGYYDGERLYDKNEEQKIKTAMELVQRHKDDKFIIFVHTKRTGELVKSTLKSLNIECEFHNANLSLEKRLQVEKKFKESPNFRVIVATSTIAWGLNLPARRVVILGVHRGLQMVENYDIAQMCGRAGRPKYDPAGDAYILVPESSKKEWRAKLEKKHPITSQMLEDASGQGHYKVLAFHLVSEIHTGNVLTVEDIHKWYHRTFACHQSQILDDSIVDRVIKLLLQCKAIVEENGEFKCTSIGMIASMFYFSPFDVADLKNNFWKMFSENNEDDDYWLSVALGNLDTFRFGVCNKAERTEMVSYQAKIDRIFGKGAILDSAVKTAYAYYCILNGKDAPVFNALIQTLKVDSSRVMEVLSAIDSMSGKWNQRKYITDLKMRLMYGVKAELIELCQIPNIGKARAEKLYQLKIRTVEDFVKYETKLPLLLNMGREKVAESVEAAKKLVLEKMLG